jgi:glyoxylate reductase
LKDFQGSLADTDGIICYYHGFQPVGGMNKELVDSLPKKVKVLAVPSVGYDFYDVKALQEKCVILCNSPGMSGHSVADQALYLVLQVYRFFNLFEASLREVKHSNEARRVATGLVKTSGLLEPSKAENNFCYGERAGPVQMQTPNGHRVGIVGFGSIGREIGKRLVALGMNIHYHKRTPLGPDEQVDYPIVFHESFEEMCKISDLLVLACPLNERTLKMVNVKTIALLPQGAKIVNIGRGKLIDESALADALESGKISSVGLDVFENEPLIEPRLINRLDVSLTPHTGGSTIESWNSQLNNCLRNVESVLIKKNPGPHAVNLV